MPTPRNRYGLVQEDLDTILKLCKVLEGHWLKANKHENRMDDTSPLRIVWDGVESMMVVEVKEKGARKNPAPNSTE
jgi:hypothetical protein